MKDDPNQISHMLSEIDNALSSILNILHARLPDGLVQMLDYQMGWARENQKYVSENHGKRLRPLFLLLVCASMGGDWKKALTASTAIEILHNFSLVHDDIEDKSEMRRGRETMWVKWGIEQTINTGDALYAIANESILTLSAQYPLEVANKAYTLFFQSALDLTCGQYLDISFEKKENVEEIEYWQMLEGKTGALLGACFGIGATLAGCNSEIIDRMKDAGKGIGLAFQVQDDYLGIWGDENVTGKSTSIDLIERKKTYPILLGFQEIDNFQEIWMQPIELENNNVTVLKTLLEQHLINQRTLLKANELYELSYAKLDEILPNNDAKATLLDLIRSLFYRSY